MKALLARVLGKSFVHTANDFEIFMGGNLDSRNILIFTEHINATYYIFFDIPLRRLHVRGEVNFAVVSQKHVMASGVGCWKRWAESFRPDVVVLTRYGQPHGADILEFFHRQGIPVIYHIDDNLLEIPESLGAEIRQRQGAEDVVEARRHLLGKCDLIYASTGYLAAVLHSWFPTQRVFHGICAPYMGAYVQVADPPERSYPVVGYMGSKGHQHDLELVVPALERLLDERPDLHFEVFGTIQLPPALKRFGVRIYRRQVQTSYLDFLVTLASLRWEIGLAPLADVPFNRCKAPTKFIEYTACCIPVVASRNSVYEDVIPEGGGILVKNDWFSDLSNFLDDVKLRTYSVATARTHCLNAFAPKKLEKQLLGVVDSVLKSK